MAVDDHGLEALKKSAEEVIPGDSSDYYHKVGLFDRETGSAPAISPSGAIETAELIRLIGGNFESGALLGHIWRQAAVGTGAVTSVNGEAVLSTGATANSSVQIQSFRRARFVTATFNKAHCAFSFPSFDNPDVVRRFGFYDPVLTVANNGDGVFFQNDGGVFSMQRRRNGVIEDNVPSGGFNGGNPLVADGNIHVYEFTYNAGRIDLLQDRKLLHRMLSISSVAYETIHLPLGSECINQNGNTTENTLLTRGFSTSRIGNASAVPEPFSITAAGSATIKNSPARVRNIIVTNAGSGAATISVYDSPTAGTNLIFSMTTSTLLDFPFNFETSNGLSYTATGNNFEIVVVFD